MKGTVQIGNLSLPVLLQSALRVTVRSVSDTSGVCWELGR